MIRITILIAVVIPTLLFGKETSAIKNTVPLNKVITQNKTGHRFYLKTEILNTGLRFFFVKPTYDIDIQATFRLNNRFHFVTTYGKTTYDLSGKTESVLRPGVFMETRRLGTAFNRLSCMFRYFPFHDFDNTVDYLFIEGGVHFQRYKGTTEGSIYDTTTSIVESSYIEALDMYRYGPQINIGISQYFDHTPNPAESKKSTVFFSPEIFIGVLYNQIYMLKDEYTQLTGTTEHNLENQGGFRLTLRFKLGIGFL